MGEPLSVGLHYVHHLVDIFYHEHRMPYTVGGVILDPPLDEREDLMRYPFSVKEQLVRLVIIEMDIQFCSFFR